MCVCSATKEATTVLSAPVQMGLDDCLEYIAEDELVEACVSYSNCIHDTATFAATLK